MDITELYCDIDDFCKEFSVPYPQSQLTEGNRQRNRDAELSLGEMLTILIEFHRSEGYRNFKGYYDQGVSKELKACFPKLISYSRFVSWIPRLFLPLCAYLSTRRGKATGIYFVDSTKLSVCDNHRIRSHKVFQGLAERGKTSMGWFYGLKLHLITNEQGELMSLRITPGNVDDREPVPEMAQGLQGSIFGDKGYISQELFEKLQKHLLRLVTKVRKNMKQRLLSSLDRLLLRKRAVIESINDQLKNIAHIDHTRHRSPINAMIHLMAGVAAYTWLPHKPSIRIHPKDMEILHGMTPKRKMIAL